MDRDSDAEQSSAPHVAGGPEPDETRGVVPGPRLAKRARLQLGAGMLVVALSAVATAVVVIQRKPGAPYGGGYRLVVATPSATVDPSALTTTTTAPGQVGLDSPLTAQGVQLQVFSVTREQSFDQSSPSNPNDTLLVVKAKVFSGSSDSLQRSTWPVTLTDDTGEKHTPAITRTSSISGRLDEAGWVFVVSKSAASFRLEVPGSTLLALDALLSSGPRSPPTTTTTTRPDPNLLLREHYSSSDGWFQGQQGKWQLSQRDGKYSVLGPMKTNEGTLVPAPISGAYPVAAIEADVGKASVGKALYGLACRDDGQGRSYQALIDATGYFRLSRIDRANGRSRTLVEAKSRARYVTGLDATASHLALRCSGDPAPGRPAKITLSVNGRNVAEAVDQRGLAPGGVGVAVVARNETVEVAFSNFVARKD